MTPDKILRFTARARLANRSRSVDNFLCTGIGCRIFRGADYRYLHFQWIPLLLTACQSTIFAAPVGLAMTWSKDLLFRYMWSFDLGDDVCLCPGVCPEKLQLLQCNNAAHGRDRGVRSEYRF